MADPTGILPAVLLGGALLDAGKADAPSGAPLTSRAGPRVDEFGDALDGIPPEVGDAAAPANNLKSTERGIGIPLEPFTSGGVRGEQLLDEGNASISRVKCFRLPLRATTDLVVENDFHVLRTPGNTLACLWLDQDSAAFKINERGTDGSWCPLRVGDVYRFDAPIKEWHLRLPPSLQDYTVANGFNPTEPFAQALIVVGWNLDINAVRDHIGPACTDSRAIGVSHPGVAGVPVPAIVTDCRRTQLVLTADANLNLGAAAEVSALPGAEFGMLIGRTLVTRIEVGAGSAFSIDAAVPARLQGLQLRKLPPVTAFL